MILYFQLLNIKEQKLHGQSKAKKMRNYLSVSTSCFVILFVYFVLNEIVLNFTLQQEFFELCFLNSTILFTKCLNDVK